MICAPKVNRKHARGAKKRDHNALVTYIYIMNLLHTAIIIPARYGSTRLPGKPLTLIAGQTMLSRVVEIARAAAASAPNTQVYVATDDTRIAGHCAELNVVALMTDVACASGTDRVAQATQALPNRPDFILNLQGDAPLTPPDFLTTLIESFASTPCDVITPVTQLSWDELETLKAQKQTTPHSGTSAVFNQETHRALWFSKQVIPAIRNEEILRQHSPLSPVFRHIGLYGYSYDMLMAYSGLSESYYEPLEGLEQLRLLEQGIHMRCVPVSYDGRPSMSGVDSPQDVARAETLLAQFAPSRR